MRSLIRFAARATVAGMRAGTGKSRRIVRYPQPPFIPRAGDPGQSWETDSRIHGRRVVFTRRFVFPLSTTVDGILSADDPAAEADGYGMGA